MTVISCVLFAGWHCLLGLPPTTNIGPNDDETGSRRAPDKFYFAFFLFSLINILHLDYLYGNHDERPPVFDTSGG